MKNKLKRPLLIALALMMLVAAAAAPGKSAKAAVTGNNLYDSDLDCSISSTGLLEADISVIGYQGITTHIEVRLCVEKLFLGFYWYRVDIGEPDNLWIRSVNWHRYTNTFSHQLSSTGTYRVTAVYTVSGTGGPDEVKTYQRTKYY